MTEIQGRSSPRVGRAILVAPLLTTALVMGLGLVADIIVALRSSPAYFGAVGHLSLTFGMAALFWAFATQLGVLPVFAILNSRGMLSRRTVIWSTSAVAILALSTLNRVLGIRLDVTSFMAAAVLGAVLGYFYGRFAWPGAQVQHQSGPIGAIPSER